MSKVYDSVMRAQRERDSGLVQSESGGLRDRLRSWLPRRRVPEPSAPIPEVAKVEIDLETMSSPEDFAAELQEKFASIQVAVDVLDTRISAEIVEREAKILEEIGRGMRGIETELLHRMATTATELRRTVVLSTAIVVGACVLVGGITIWILLKF
jgi:hypothetical protein